MSMLVAVLCAVAQFFLVPAPAQQAPPASGARILLLPRRIVSGERATLAVLDVNGRLTPGVTVSFSNGDKLTTNATGRALFVAPLIVTNSMGFRCVATSPRHMAKSQRMRSTPRM